MARGRFCRAHPRKKLFIAFFLLMVVAVLSGFSRVASAAEQGIHPSAPPSSALQPKLTWSMRFTGPGGDVLEAGKKGTLVLTLVNEDEVPAENVVIDIGEEGENGAAHADILYERRLVIDVIGPRETVSREVNLFASGGAQSREVILTAHIPGYGGAAYAERTVRIQLKPVDLPRLSVSVVGVRDPDGNSRIEAGKIVRLSVRIWNHGTGDASQVSAHVRTWRDVFVAGDGNTYFELGDIAAGKFADFAFLVYTGVRTARGRNVPVTVYVHEARSRCDVIVPLELPSGGIPPCEGDAEGPAAK
jgi:hypothetical protein